MTKIANTTPIRKLWQNSQMVLAVEGMIEAKHSSRADRMLKKHNDKQILQNRYDKNRKYHSYKETLAKESNGVGSGRGDQFQGPTLTLYIPCEENAYIQCSHRSNLVEITTPEGASRFTRETLMLRQDQRMLMAEMMNFHLYPSPTLRLISIKQGFELQLQACFRLDCVDCYSGLNGGVNVLGPIKRGQLNWQMCYKIICGIARQILYLDEDSRLRIVDRDLKASNVLLDKEMNLKIADFGLARLFSVNQIQGNTRTTVGTTLCFTLIQIDGHMEEQVTGGSSGS
ncbi:cysteine-rich receptor-like protein kinase 8 [Hibiscus syriacus]|uniref:cysteine-rich receptor-like protein kinase 8 n=1 Tax=Hibiscus syriacus TaxID=106335 RepID=UPI00192418DA|nr:cysteine-rich receptor-like protein kinase 8 [Hibiscus syriacus]